MQLDFCGEGFRCAQSARLGISKIIRSSKQRGGLGEAQPTFSILTSHTAKSTQSWEKEGMEREPWQQSWGMAGFHAACSRVESG